MLRLVSAFMLICVTSAWVPSSPSRTTTTTTQLQATRTKFLKTVATTTAAVALGGLVKIQPASAETLENGITYEVVKKGDGPKPDVGELIAIRFAAYNGPVKIDDIFDTPEPYYTRLGSGGLIKGVEQTLPLMRLGDRWKLTIPGKLAFGDKGRPASAGKPRIPGNAEIVFDVEIVGLPGKEPELIELIGDV